MLVPPLYCRSLQRTGVLAWCKISKNWSTGSPPSGAVYKTIFWNGESGQHVDIIIRLCHPTGRRLEKIL